LNIYIKLNLLLLKGNELHIENKAYEKCIHYTRKLYRNYRSLNSIHHHGHTRHEGLDHKLQTILREVVNHTSIHQIITLWGMLFYSKISHPNKRINLT